MLLIFCAVEGFRVEFLVCYQKDRKVQVFPGLLNSLGSTPALLFALVAPRRKRNASGVVGIGEYIHTHIYVCNTFAYVFLYLELGSRI